MPGPEAKKIKILQTLKKMLTNGGICINLKYIPADLLQGFCPFLYGSTYLQISSGIVFCQSRGHLFFYSQKFFAG